MASVIKLKNGIYRAQIRIKGHKQLTKQFPTKKEAQKWGVLKEEEFLNKKPTKQEDKDLAKKPLSHFIDRYIGEAEERGDPFKRSKLGALHMVKRGLGKVPFNALNRDSIIDYAKRRANGQITDKKAGGVTIQQELTYLNQVLNVANLLWNVSCDKKIISEARSALEYAGMNLKGNERSRRPSDAELLDIKDYFDSKARQKVPMSDIIDFAVATGLRAGEITRIKWADLNKTNKSIIVRDRKHPILKKGNDQEVPLLNLNGLDAYEIAIRQPQTDERIFPWPEHTFSSLFPRACRAKKINDLRFHDLRHEFCSRMGESGKFTIFDIAACSGHRDMNMLKRYVNLTALSIHKKNI